MHIRVSKLAMATMPFVIALGLSACGGSSSSGGSDPVPQEDWGTSTGEIDKAAIPVIETPEIKEDCDVKSGALIVDGNYDKYLAYMWNDNGELRKWPGEEFTENAVPSCEKNIHYFVSSDVASMVGYNTIVNAGEKPQTNDGNVYTLEKPCLKFGVTDGDSTNATFVTATECGVTVDGVVQDIPSDVYASNGAKTLTPGSIIQISEIDGKPETGYVTLTLVIKSLAGEDATGTYWFGDNETSAVAFANGEKIKVGDKVKVAEGETKDIVLNIKYDVGDGPIISSYTIKKTFSVKNDECRLNEQKETLGAVYSAEKTIFRIWSPDSSEVKVTVDGQAYDMVKASLDCYTNVYEATVDGDLAGKAYQFSIAGKDVRDPYGRMVDETSANGNIVMDLSKTEPEGGWAVRPALKNREDSVIYEVHVRDFTIDPTSGVTGENRGRYLGMVETGTKHQGVATGIDHLKELGVTHVQIQPFYDYATCSAVDSQNNTCYNWGYDPWNYNVPEERYSKYFQMHQYNDRVQEVKTMINEFHKNGIRVIMDVVYNHTFNKSVFSGITGKYYLEKDASGCGNTVNADQNMVWTMIRDSMDYWVSEYHVDGFRLDLVGAFGIKDFSDWGVYLNKKHPDANLVIYGEPWAADNDAADAQVKDTVRTGRMHMASADAHVGAFNNRIRNCLRGGAGNDASTLGFIFNKYNTDGYDDNGSDENDVKLEDNKSCVFMGVKAGVRHADATGTDVWSAQGFSDPEQTVSYITCHDNLALRDRIEEAKITGDEAKTLQVYANSILSISQGMMFIHGGEEFGRTKILAGDKKHNTYDTITGANDFKWDLKAGEWKSVNDAYASYIKMRKDHPAFRMTTAEQIFANVTLDEASTNEVVIVNIKGSAVGDEWKNIKIVMNSTKTEAPVKGVSDMTKVADGFKVGDSVVDNDKAAAQAVSIWAEVAAPDERKHEAMYVVGSMNGWNATNPDPMTFKDGKWSIELTLDTDSIFKVLLNTNGWADNDANIFGLRNPGDTQLCSAADGCNNGDAANVKPGLAGKYDFIVNDSDMTFELKAKN